MQHNNVDSLTRYYMGGRYEADVVNDTITERLYLGGGYYDGVAVLVKKGNTSNIYYIARDHLGSITHIIDSNGTVIQELSYDAWGRLRNPQTNAVYAPGSEPKLFLGRGYCGHEHLVEMGLINMNARLYDPLLGRFLSPDPYVQLPDFSQNFNRYSYCLNNPLVYVDKDGKSIWLLAGLIIGAYIGGVSSNHGELNPLQWNYNSVTTYLGIGFGGFAGYCGAYALVYPGSFSVLGSIATPIGSVGYNTYTLGKGTDWKFNLQWTTSAGGSGSIFSTPIASAERNANKAFNKVRNDYYDFMDWANDWNNMIGDVSSAFSRYGGDNIKSYFHTISNYSGAFSYGIIALRCGVNMTITENDMLDLFETAGGDIGSYIGGRAISTGFAFFSSEFGPYTSACAAAIGYAGGSLIGRNYGEGLGRDLFYNLAKPAYEQYIEGKRANHFVLDYNNYIYIHYPLVYPY